MDRRLSLLVLLAFAPACTFDTRGTALPGDDDPAAAVDAGTDPVAPDAGGDVVDPDAATVTASCRVDGALLGVAGVLVTGGSTTFTIDAWLPWDGHDGAFVGFTLSDDAAAMRYQVRAGDRYDGEGVTWVHPELADDPDRVRAISRIDFCGG